MLHQKSQPLTGKLPLHFLWRQVQSSYSKIANYGYMYTLQRYMFKENCKKNLNPHQYHLLLFQAE